MNMEVDKNDFENATRAQKDLENELTQLENKHEYVKKIITSIVQAHSDAQLMEMRTIEEANKKCSTVLKEMNASKNEIIQVLKCPSKFSSSTPSYLTKLCLNYNFQASVAENNATLKILKEALQDLQTRTSENVENKFLS